LRDLILGLFAGEQLLEDQTQTFGIEEFDELYLGDFTLLQT
jgi:hypothetical protein